MDAFHFEPDLLRFTTAGSVDDGKSTLIGRLMYDTKTIFEDQLAALERVSQHRGDATVDLALLTDGLRAEREQGITIDVAYRYFATPRRKFIIADTPGHLQYTRNMVTGASTAQLAVLLVDARKGVIEQTRRHAFIASLLRLQHVVLAVNKMDLVDWREEVFDQICQDFRRFASRLDLPAVTFIPLSALRGDNLVEHSANMRWYGGPTLLYHLEHVYVGNEHNAVDPRFPVQYVIRPQTAEHHDFRGYAGRVAGGVFKAGDEVVVLPSGFRTRVKEVRGPSGPVEQAFPPMSVTLTLEDEIDISRGDLLAKPNNLPSVGQDIDAMLVWFSPAKPLAPKGRYLLRQGTRETKAIVQEICYKVDLSTLHKDESGGPFAMNDIGRVRLRTAAPLIYDPYRRNRQTGSFILVDEFTHETVAAGMIR